MLKTTLLLLLFIVLSCNSYAQKQGKSAIDSMLNELPKQKEDTNKVNLLNALSRNYGNIKPDEGVKYGEQALELAVKLAWQRGAARANFRIGLNYQLKPDNNKSIEYLLKSLKFYEENGDKHGAAEVSYTIATTYMNAGDFAKALESGFKALHVYEETGATEDIARISGNISLFYFYQSDYTKALEYAFKSQKAFEKTTNKDGLARANMNIGIAYHQQAEYGKALEYYFKCLKLAEETGNKVIIGRSAMDIGAVYFLNQDNTKALEYYNKALKADEESGDKQSIASINGCIAGIYSSDHNYPTALEHYFQELSIDEEIGSKDDGARALGNIGLTYTDLKDYQLAITYQQDALGIAKEIGDKHMQAMQLWSIGNSLVTMMADTLTKNTKAPPAVEMAGLKHLPVTDIPASKAARLHMAVDNLNNGLAISLQINVPDLVEKCYHTLDMAYRQTGNYKKALECADNARAIRDSVFSADNDKKIMQQGIKHEYEKREDSIKLDNAKKEKIAALKFQQQRNYTYMGVSAILLLLGFSFFIVKERGKSEAQRKIAETERMKSDGLLLNILPAEVATELKTSGTTKARHFDNVTVLFTDFVNFTNAGERMSAQELIDELHTCFKAFDEITAKYGIEKIKTIGDAYLAVAGLPSPDPLHAENILQTAKEINNFMRERQSKPGNSTFEIRMGIHSGSVVAGVVGVKKFAYDIWGDTVNTAARMEQNSEAGKINISQATYDLVKDKIACDYRGEIEAKGKGMMKMYYIR